MAFFEEADRGRDLRFQFPVLRSLVASGQEVEDVGGTEGESVLGVRLCQVLVDPANGSFDGNCHSLVQVLVELALPGVEPLRDEGCDGVSVHLGFAGPGTVWSLLLDEEADRAFDEGGDVFLGNSALGARLEIAARSDCAQILCWIQSFGPGHAREGLEGPWALWMILRYPGPARVRSFHVSAYALQGAEPIQSFGQTCRQLLVCDGVAQGLARVFEQA